MLEFDKRTNTLEQTEYEYALQDVPEPHLYRLLYNYDEVPKIPFNHRLVPMHPADEFLISDTTFRDGQQARAPYTVEQIVQLYKFMSQLSGPNGIIRQSEFFLYSQRDRDALEACRALGLQFPEITSWIRATSKDFQLVKDIGIEETGILCSCSDYHIFKKLHMTRAQAMDQFLGVVKDALAIGVKPRVHLEDLTRADFYGFVVPIALELEKLSEEAGVGIKLRACDTLGLGVNFPGVALPRSVCGIAYGLWHHARFPHDRLEWHGHNDFYKAVGNASTAWLYGIGTVNCTLLGIGERTGNTPLEAMVFEYASLRGTMDGMDPTVITEIADYYEKELDYKVPQRTPFVGSDFNTTRAGIHADGLLKDPEIYTAYNTDLILNTSPRVLINQNSGAAGLMHWLQEQFGDDATARIGKRDERLLPILRWIEEEYQGGRVTAFGDEELMIGLARYSPELLVALKDEKETVKA